MSDLVLGFQEVDRADVGLVGGKGAQLGGLCRIDGIRVPDGFCVTTAAFRRAMADAPAVDGLVDRLSVVDADDLDALRSLAAEIRATIEGGSIPDEVAGATRGALAQLADADADADADACASAVRSSATAEDLPTTSFAGQHDSYLNVCGLVAVLEHVQRCWASLFSERAVSYRVRNGIDHRRVEMAVVVQRMVAAEAAGVLFTADPVSSNRKIASVEATPGLGDALVSGLVNPDVYTVRDGEVISSSPARPGEAVLSDALVVEVVGLGRRIEAHAGSPQDVEWCLADGGFWIVQSRPITTLFPIPAAEDDENHVYVSVGHQQMMTDPMKPLGLSLWQLTAAKPMPDAGGRLFVDVTAQLASPATSAGIIAGLGRSDPLIGDALQTIVDRDDFVLPPPEQTPSLPPGAGPPATIETDPATVRDLVSRIEASDATVTQEIRSVSGPAVFDFILDDIEELRRTLFDPLSLQVILAGMEAVWWLNDHLEEWLGVRGAGDVLIQSVPDDVTSEMGLGLLDVADAIRPHPDVTTFLHEFLREAAPDGFLDDLEARDGGRVARDAIEAWLERFGGRGVGEIDITRPRWSERPDLLVPLILGHVENFAPGERGRRVAHGLAAVDQKRQDLVEHLRATPDGEQRADETERMIDRARTFIGYREYPKYGWMRRYALYKQALLGEARRLVEGGVLRGEEDIDFLTFQELHEVARTSRVDDELIRRRKDAFESYRALTPPRVLTSDGETLAGRYRRDDVPAGALVGLPVSAGTVEGRARVVLDLAQADLEPGDILVTPFTDPSWTPVFVTIAGLVTEVGGLMTHGAVVAREYGLPTVVGVEDATRLIPDGQRIRIHGTEGYVELLT